ncbi:MAG: hypothetical protein AAFX95_15840 [Cyanobacteria bacterium J06639_16]
MASIQRVSVLSGFAAAAALAGALPGHASEIAIAANAFDANANVASQPLTLDELSAASLEGVQFADQTLGLDTTVTELPLSEEAEVTADTTAIEQLDADTVGVETEAVETEAEAEVAEISSEPAADALVHDEAVTTSASLLLQSDEILALIETPAADREAADGPEVLAQSTAPLYRGIAPAYLGVGGNIGIIDSDESGTGDFAFSLFGKVSLGPRFSVRPALFVSEDDTSLAIPITFNFSPLQLYGFTVAPFVGGGVDISGDTGALVNAGIDVPISQQFTLTAQGNFRVSNDSGLGLLLGVAYNIPLFFE